MTPIRRALVTSAALAFALSPPLAVLAGAEPAIVSSPVSRTSSGVPASPASLTSSGTPAAVVDERRTLDVEALRDTGVIELEVSEDAVSFLLTLALEDERDGVGINRVIAPDGTVVHETVFEDDSWEAVEFASELVAWPVVGSGDLALFASESPRLEIAPGTWRIELETDPPDARFAHAMAVVRTEAGADAETVVPRTVDLHVHVLHPDERYRTARFAEELEEDWREIIERPLAPHRLGIGTISSSVAPIRETTRLAEIEDERELGEACRAIRRAGRETRAASGNTDNVAVHVGLVRTISGGAMPEDFADDEADSLTGLSPQPGLPFDDESVNACVFVVEGPWRWEDEDGDSLDEATVVELLASTLLHELGHFLGLSHPSEIDGETFDLIDDTPRCTEPDPEACGIAGGAGNFLFHSGDERSPETTVTSGQAAVLRAHPLFRPVAGKDGGG